MWWHPQKNNNFYLYCTPDNNTIICKTVLCVFMLIKLIESYRLEVDWKVVGCM